MTRRLVGSELADFIKERQARQVRNLRQQYHITPKLAIVVTDHTPVITTYVGLKRQYGADILIDVDVYTVAMPEVMTTIDQLNHDPSIHAIIVQLPLSDPGQTDKVVRAVAVEKDVDGLGSDEYFTPATALAIQWLLSGYGIDLAGKNLLIVGRGRLVGAPLEKLWRDSQLNPVVADRSMAGLDQALETADIVVTATGQPGLITADHLHHGAIAIDAGTASEDGKIIGDLAPDVYERSDLILTPQKGGVGPLTVSALFDNVIQAARWTASHN